MPARPQPQPQQRRRRHPHRPPSKQLLQIREEGGSSYADSKTTSPFLYDTPSWSSRTSPSATAAIDGRAGGAGGTDSVDRGSGAEMTSTGDSDDNGGDNNEAKRIAAKLSRARHSPQHPRQSRCYLRMSPRVTSARKAKSGDRRRASSSGSGLDRAAAAAVRSSATSLVRSLQAPMTSSSAVLGGHVTYYGPLSSRSLCESDGIEADTQNSKSDCGGSDGGTAFAIPGSANDDVRRTTAGCKPETAVSCNGDSGSRAYASSSPPSITVTASTTPLTYAAVASSSLHGKRLPQSRVSFSQWRKRLCCGSASMPNTIDGANTTPGTSSRAAAAFLNTFPSAPLTLTTPLAATTASTPRATGKSTSTRAPSVDGDGNAADDGDGKTSMPSGDEHDCTSARPQHLSVSAVMPPLPPSVHRHKPTHLILQLPHAPPPQQARNGPDSDEDMASSSSPRNVGTPGIAATTNELPSPVALPSKSNGTATAAAAPSLSLSASEVASATGVRMPGVQTGTQQHRQQLNALIPVMSPSYTAFGPATPTRGGAKSSSRPKVSATAAAAAGKGMRRVPSAASFFSAAEILPGLFLGAYVDATDTEALAAHGISLVINCSYECPVTSAMVNNSHHVRYAQCPLRDHSDEAIAPFFTPVTRIIHEQLHRRQINHQRMARRAATSAPGVHVNDFEDREMQGGMLWAWADEAENVWVVPPSLVSPRLPVGGQPSFKESKRETPRTPSSTQGLGARFGDGAGCSSTTTSCSPSPSPGGNATFPPLAAEAPGATTAAAAAAPGSAGMPSAKQNGSNGRTNALFNTAPAPAFTAATSFTATTAPPPDAAAITALPASSSAPSPLTVVDPRDCGGVLVCCRMGVSRSATFIIAYLILYGCTLAPLDDTASLFVHFLERERRIIEEAGGLTFFTDNNGGVSTTSSPALATAPACPGSGSRCVNGALASHGSPGVNGVQPFVQNLLAPNSPRTLRRSAMIPVSSPLSLGGGCVAGSLTTPLSGNASTMSQQRLPTGSPTTHIELASRLCQPCYLLHLRERRLQQKTQRRLLISGQQQLKEQRDEVQQMVALSASCMAARKVGQGCGWMGSVEDNSNFGDSSSAVASGRSDGGHQEEQQQQHRHVLCALPSSAPVTSYRSARGSRAMTLLEAAYADERVHADDGVDEEGNRQQEDGSRMAVGQRSESLAVVSTTATPTLKRDTQKVRSNSPTHKVCVAAAEAAPTTPDYSAVADERRGDGENVYETPLSPAEQEQVPLLSPCAILPTQPPMKGRPPSDLNASAGTLLGVSFTSSGGGGGSGSAFGGAAPAMTYREAFDVAKRQKADVNPNIGFVLALRELAGGGGDFSFSTSF
ncbi:phophatase-like protein [Leishmania major strain Friedlin]|uniref:Phophatase-like protein n=1 Tax=Leishmania major TaxID=5664 RepID=Q4QJD0_LEIMA|nr:phophatase-like protein [Leishmania major strain Friedlin]CAG9568252.1 phophatase-like_protein [Leishmania major strain Friedlin]CAJ01992.1 phophatase-like protein [Leishmania major strain Friedlin]|eukprot:XP_001687549.1 phophatase-like protein [Leishmania major strain Friedlin]